MLQITSPSSPLVAERRQPTAITMRRPDGQVRRSERWRHVEHSDWPIRRSEPRYADRSSGCFSSLAFAESLGNGVSRSRRQLDGL
jgi:hypothetical protein